MSKLLDQVRSVLRTRHYSYRTEKTYVEWILRYIRFHGVRHPLGMGAAEVEREFGKKFSWLQTENLTSSLLVAALRLSVDAGEAEAIALASEKSCLLISDDKQARAAAKRLGATVIGTVGVLVRAKQNGVVSAIKPILDDLELNNFFISRALREEALKLVGE